jgi:hypothetical protein
MDANTSSTNVTKSLAHLELFEHLTHVFAEKHAATCRADVKNSKIISFMLENL